MRKFIFCTGGVVSRLAKGITVASSAAPAQPGLFVAVQKLDPLSQRGPGTMRPLPACEVYVTDDGAETDLDLVTMSGSSTST